MTGPPPREKRMPQLSPRGVLIACVVSLLVAMHGWGTVNYHWPILWAVPGLTLGPIVYPTFIYLTCGLISERGFLPKFAAALFCAAASLVLWLVTVFSIR